MSYTSIVRRLQRHKRQLKLTAALRVKTSAPNSPGVQNGRRKVAVMGAGAMGQDQCLGLNSIPYVDIIAVADVRTESLERLRKQVALNGARFYSSPEELLRTEKPDLVCVATNTTAHLAVAQFAVEAGVRCLVVEKPIGNNVARAREFAALCADRGVKVAVNHSRRWVSDYSAIKRCVAYGLIGNLREIHSSTGPGGLAMIGSHYFDLIAYLAESRIARVTAYLDSSDKPNKRGAQFQDPGGHCLMQLENGTRAYLDVSDDLGQWQGFTTLRGDEGRIEIDELAREWHLVSSILGRRSFNFRESGSISACFAKVAVQVLSDDDPSCGTAQGIEALEAVAAAHLSDARGHAAIHLPIRDEDADMEMPLP